MNNLEIIQMTHAIIVHEDNYAYSQQLTTEQIGNAYSNERYQRIGLTIVEATGLQHAIQNIGNDQELWQRAYFTPTQYGVQQEMYFGPAVGWVNFRPIALSNSVGLFRFNPRLSGVSMRCPVPSAGKG